MERMNGPKELTVKVKKLNKIKADIFLLSFDSAYISKHSYPGQFLHVKIIKTILRRPFSIHYIKGKTVFILFRIRGRATKSLSGYKPGDKINVIGPLGKGFCLNGKSDENILLAGGLGVAPLVFLAQRLKKVISSKFKIKSLILTDQIGIEAKDNYYIASPERAFLDVIYLNKDYHFDNLSVLNWDKVFNILPIYKNKRMVKKVNEYFKDFKDNQ